MRDGAAMGRLLRHLLCGVVALAALPASAGEPACSQDDAHERAACALEAAAATVLCDEAPAAVARRSARQLARAGRLVRRAGAAARPVQAARLLAASDRRLLGADRRVRRAAERGRLVEGCAADARAELARLRGLVTVLAADGAALPGLPPYVAGFEQWLRLNAAPLPVRPGDPHRGLKDVFVNRTRAELAPDGEQRFPYPNGSIVVKASTRPGEDFVWLVAIMRKRAGSDPAHGNWAFVEFTRQRAGERFEVAARDAVCWGCHADVGRASDWVFTLLE